MKTWKSTTVALIVVLIFAAFFVLKDSKKLTYLEWHYENENSENYIELKSNNEYIEQKFKCPYELLHGVAIKISTFSRDNNSMWDVALIDSGNGNLLYSKKYNASLIDDNSFHIFEFDKNIRVQKNAEYIIRISAADVNENTSLAFYTGLDSESYGLVNNGNEMPETLCFSLYGGDFDIWWIAYLMVITLALIILIIRAAIVAGKGTRPVDDILTGSMLIFFMVLLLLNSFSVSGEFTDELDNIRGGMIIANGGVLYKDYVTQHTPVMYYICSVFSLLGAKSLEQFRLSYFLFEAMIWGLLYARHFCFFGKKRLFCLTALECIFVTSILKNVKGYMILSDGMQGLCMVVLLLEFLRYYQDRKLNWDRCIIISLSIWGSVGAAFISVYAIFFVGIPFFALELLWNKNGRPSLLDIIDRYSKLVVCVLVPFVTAVTYFAINHSLRRAFEQCYLFNREVYSTYYTIGDNIFEPFITSIQSYFDVIAGKFNAIITLTASNADILQFAIVTIATIVTVSMCLKKRYVESLTLFAVMLFSASRGYDYHGIAAWYVAIMIIAMFGKGIFEVCDRKVIIPLGIIFGVFSISLYAETCCSNLLYKQQPIKEIESRIIDITDHNERILIDAYCCDSIYLCYKNRYPVNRACYMLAWYMDWYEQDTIDDLNTYKPRIVVYDPEQKVWGYQYYTNAFYKELKNNYAQFSENPEDDWKNKIWIRTN